MSARRLGLVFGLMAALTGALAVAAAPLPKRTALREGPGQGH